LTTNILKLSFIEIVTVAKIYVAVLASGIEVRGRIYSTYNAGYFRNVFQIA